MKLFSITQSHLAVASILVPLTVLVAIKNQGVLSVDLLEQEVTAGKIGFLGKLRKLYDFDSFKKLFKRSYKSSTEELVRKKLFLGRAFEVFVSLVRYKHRESSFYLAINKFSDWTPKELDEMRLRTNIQAMFESSENSERSIENTSFDDKEDLAAESTVVDGPPEVKVEEIEKKMYEILEDEQDEERLSRQRRDVDTSVKRKKSRLSLTSDNLDMNESGFFKSIAEDVAGLIARKFRLDAKSSLPDQVFTDLRGCLTEPRDQGRCGACYIFATTSLYEWHYCNVTNGQRVRFSEQYMIDCGAERVEGVHGCSGGQFTEVNRFARYYGLELLENYPYKGRNATCPYELNTPESIMGHTRITDDKWQLIDNQVDMENYLKQGPMVVNLNWEKSLWAYGGGLYDPLRCKRSWHHSVLLVGSGRENGQEYWLFRNSWGDSFGLNGYFKMSKRASRCIRVAGRIKNFNVLSRKS